MGHKHTIGTVCKALFPTVLFRTCDKNELWQFIYGTHKYFDMQMPYSKIILITIFFTLAATISVAQSQDWRWQNPLPQGNTLRGVAYPAADNLWAVGDGGTMLRSRDNGLSWKRYPLSVTTTFYSVCFPDKRHGFAFGLDDQQGSVIYRTTDGGDSWVLTAHDSSFVLSGISFSDSMIGAAIGVRQIFPNQRQNFVYRTTDGGISWAIQIVEQTDLYTLFSVCTVGPKNVWVTGNSGIILRSTDGGNTWQDQSNSEWGDLMASSFQDPEHGWVVGAAGTVLHTTNGGMTWNLDTVPQDSLSPGYIVFSSVSFADKDNGFITADYGAILHTSTGGKTWNTVTLNGMGTGNNFVTAVAALSNDSAIAVGQFGAVLTTSDAGMSWTARSHGSVNDIFEIVFIDSLKGFAADGTNSLLRTTDGGQHWTTYRVLAENERIYLSQFLGPLEGWGIRSVTDSGSFLLHTTDGGEQWAMVRVRDTPHVLPFGLHFLNHNTGTVVGWGGTINRTTDAGSTWVTQSSGTTHDLHVVQLLDNRIGFIGGGRGSFLRTADGGSSWTETPLADTNKEIFSMYFINSTTGWIGTWAPSEPAEVLKTTDAGTSWSVETAIGNRVVSAISFTDSLHGWMAGQAGSVFITTDGGRSWSLSYTGTASLLDAIAVVGNQCWVGGQYGAILHASNIDRLSSAWHPMQVRTDELRGSNYPNPFSHTTTIRFALGHSAFVRVRFVNILGQEIAQINSGFEEPGTHEITWNATGVPNGTYFCEIATGANLETIPIIVSH